MQAPRGVGDNAASNPMPTDVLLMTLLAPLVAPHLVFTLVSIQAIDAYIYI